MTSPRRTGKKSKARDHHLEEQATVPKKSRANQLPEPCRSSRAGAGSGGKGLQLEKIGAALEAPTQLLKTTTTLPNGSLTNPLAPVPAKKGCKKKSPTQMPPPPYRSERDEFTMPSTQSFYSPFAHGTLPPVYYNSGTHNRFGFNPSPAPPIVPPSTEPNLQALNNPYIAATCSSQSNPPVSSHFGSQSSQVPDIHTNTTIPVIDLALEAISKVPGKRPSMGHTFEDSGEGGTDSNMRNDGSESDGSEAETHIRHRSVAHQSSQSHTALPSDHKFEYSRDEDDEAAERLVRDQTGTIDVLAQHHKKNGRPHIPDPDALNTIHMAAGSQISRDDSDTDERTRAPRNSLKQKGQPAKPYQLSYYGPMWKDCLEEAKLECHVMHLLDDPFLSKSKNLHGSITEVLVTVVVERGNCGERVEQGQWPENKVHMAKLLLDDMSTWRGELKKMALYISHSFYNLQSYLSGENDLTAYVERTAAALVKRLMFLRDGFNENGKTRNFAHPTLKHLIIDFFYTGTYRIAQQCADIFRHRIPFQCLALASTAFNCVLDGFVKDGRGKHMPLFLGKNYGSIYLGILGLVEKMAKDSYHGLWLQSQLAEWAQDAWRAVQAADINIERHDHLEIELD